MTRLWRPLALTGLAAVLAAGCGGDGITRRPVTGTVQVDGSPLPNGLIEFDPLDNQPTRSSAAVKDGKYSLDSTNGLSDGKYRVRITGGGRTDPVPVPPGHVGPPPVPKEWWPVKLPEKYNRKSELEVTVKPDGNDFPFDLKGGKVQEVKTPGGK